jgi:hypothetical protein
MAPGNSTDYLEYKNHESWFRDLNSNLQSCRVEAERMLLDVVRINTFYNKVKILKSSYRGYLRDNYKEINEKLQEVENSIRTQAFVLSLKNYQSLKSEKREQFSPILWDNIDKLLLIFELIGSDLKAAELTPKPKTKAYKDPNNAVLGTY